MIPPVKSLVRYDKEVLVSTSKKAISGKDKLAKSGLKKSLPPVDPKASAQSQTEDILNSILPPRYISTCRPILLFLQRLRLIVFAVNGTKMVSCGCSMYLQLLLHVLM
jgi:hypothetical protein